MERKEYIIEIATTSYTQEDLEDDIECRLRYGDDVVTRETREASR